MCVQTYPRSRRSKSTRSSSTHSRPQKPSKHQKTNKNSSSIISKADVDDSSSSSLDCSSRSRKSVSFNEVVKGRPLHEQAKQERQQKQRLKKKSVSFHEVVMVRPVLHLADYTDQEMHASWFGLEDKQKIKRDILNTLKMVREGNFQGCTRGLEKLSDGGRSRERRRLSVQDVLEEQQNQRNNHSSSVGLSSRLSKNNGNGKIRYDASKFRKVYKPHSRAARHGAHAVGKIDEMSVACQRVRIPDISKRS